MHVSVDQKWMVLHHPPSRQHPARAPPVPGVTHNMTNYTLQTVEHKLWYLRHKETGTILTSDDVATIDLSS